MSGLDQSSASSSFLTNLRNLGYNILKSLEDKVIRDIDVPELGHAPNVIMKIFHFPLRDLPRLPVVILTIDYVLKKSSQTLVHSLVVKRVLRV